MNIIVKYSCVLCGLHKVNCEVPARVEGQDVLDWTRNTLGQALTNDHRRRSPQCNATSASDVMIPISGADMIGGPARQ